MSEELAKHLVDRIKTDLSIINTESETQLRLPDKDEMSKITSKTGATNQVIMAIDKEGKFYVVKRYIEDEQKGRPSKAGAEAEITALHFIGKNQDKKFVVPKPLGGVFETPRGEPLTAQSYLEGYLPVVNLIDTIIQELAHPPATLLPTTYEAIAELHQMGIAHGDLYFGENVGFVTMNGRTKPAFIDFELSQMTTSDEVSDFPENLRMADLVQFTAGILLKTPEDKYPNTRRNLSSIISHNYDPQLVGFNDENREKFGIVVIEAADKRNKVSDNILIYGI